MQQKQTQELTWKRINITRQPHRYLTHDDVCHYLYSVEDADEAIQIWDQLDGRAGEEARRAAVGMFAEKLAGFADGGTAESRVVFVPYLHAKKPHESVINTSIKEACYFAGLAGEFSTSEPLLDQKDAGCEPRPTDRIIVVDDAIASGARFKTAQRYLKALYGIKAEGAFLLRSPSRFERPRAVVEQKPDVFPDVIGTDGPGATFGQIPQAIIDAQEGVSVGKRISRAFGKVFGGNR